MHFIIKCFLVFRLIFHTLIFVLTLVMYDKIVDQMSTVWPIVLFIFGSVLIVFLIVEFCKWQELKWVFFSTLNHIFMNEILLFIMWPWNGVRWIPKSLKLVEIQNIKYKISFSPSEQIIVISVALVWISVQSLEWTRHFNSTSEYTLCTISMQSQHQHDGI